MQSYLHRNMSIAEAAFLKCLNSYRGAIDLRIMIQSGRADWGWKCVANHLSKFNGIRNVSGIYRREDRKSMGNFIPRISDSRKVDVGEHFHS